MSNIDSEIVPKSRPAQIPRVLSLPLRTLRTTVALMLREMTTTYGRSPGGYLWAMLEPIGGITMLTLVFGSGLRLRQPPLGISFAFFYATGMLSFMMFIRMQQKVAQSIVYSRPLLRYPAVTFFDAILARVLLNLITQLCVMVVVFGGIMILFETRTIIDPYFIFLSITMAASMAVGVGMMNAFLMPMFPIYASIWSILTTPLFFISCVLFTFEELPAGGQDLLWWNPFVHVTGMMRRGFFAHYDGAYISPMYVYTLALALSVVGYVLLGRYYRTIVDANS